MDVKGIREPLIPAITTSAEGHIVAQAAERKADELLGKTELLEEGMRRLLADVAALAMQQL